MINQYEDMLNEGVELLFFQLAMKDDGERRWDWIVPRVDFEWKSALNVPESEISSSSKPKTSKSEMVNCSSSVY
jgi:hypothetical protein